MPPSTPGFSLEFLQGTKERASGGKMDKMTQLDKNELCGHTRTRTLSTVVHRYDYMLYICLKMLWKIQVPLEQLFLFLLLYPSHSHRRH